MGKVLEQYYDYAKKKGAYMLRMQLAMQTGWTTSRVRLLADNAKNIQRVRRALKNLLKTKDIPRF